MSAVSTQKPAPSFEETKDALRELTSDEPARRVEARQRLIVFPSTGGARESWNDLTALLDGKELEAP